MNVFRHHTVCLRAGVFAMAGLLGLFAALPAADAPAPAPAAGNGSFVFTAPKEGVVLLPSVRERLLEVINNFLNRANPTLLAHLQHAPNPFFAQLPPAPAPETAAPTATSTSPSNTPPPQVTSAMKLQQVADQLKPAGALIVGQNRLILLANGDTLALGQSLRVTFPDDNAPTEILLQAVSSDSYTLQLGDTSKTFPFVAKEAASRPAPPTKPSEPKKP